MWQFYFNFKVFRDFQCVKRIHYASVFWQPGIKHSCSTHTQTRTLFTVHTSIWKWRQHISCGFEQHNYHSLPAPHIRREGGFVHLWANASYCSKSHDWNCAPDYLFSFCRDPPNISAPWLLFVLNRQIFRFKPRSKLKAHRLSHIFGK